MARAHRQEDDDELWVPFAAPTGDGGPADREAIVRHLRQLCDATAQTRSPDRQLTAILEIVAAHPSVFDWDTSVEGPSILACAATGGSTRVVRALLEAGAALCSDADAIFQLAASEADLGLCQYVASRGGAVSNAVTAAGVPCIAAPTLAAARSGSIPVLDFFLAADTHARARTEDGSSLLHEAVRAASGAAVTFLSTAGWSHRDVDCYGFTPGAYALMQRLKEGEEDEEVAVVSTARESAARRRREQAHMRTCCDMLHALVQGLDDAWDVLACVTSGAEGASGDTYPEDIDMEAAEDAEEEGRVWFAGVRLGNVASHTLPASVGGALQSTLHVTALMHVCAALGATPLVIMRAGEHAPMYFSGNTTVWSLLGTPQLGLDSCTVGGVRLPDPLRMSTRHTRAGRVDHACAAGIALAVRIDALRDVSELVSRSALDAHDEVYRSINTVWGNMIAAQRVAAQLQAREPVADAPTTSSTRVTRSRRGQAKPAVSAGPPQHIHGISPTLRNWAWLRRLGALRTRK